MRDPEAQRLAELVAAHAVLLLTLGVIAALASLATILGAIHVLRPYREALLGMVVLLIRHIMRVGVVQRAIARARSLAPVVPGLQSPGRRGGITSKERELLVPVGWQSIGDVFVTDSPQHGTAR